MPDTPPFAATARNSSSVRFRGWSFCAALPVCVKATGFFECRIASAAVRRPQWLRSTRMPRSIHPLDGLEASLAESRIRRFEASVTEEIPAVISRLNDAKPEPVQLVEPVKIGFERDAVLKSVDDSCPSAFSWPRRYPPAFRILHEHVRMTVDLAFLLADADHGLRERGIRCRRCRREVIVMWTQVSPESRTSWTKASESCAPGGADEFPRPPRPSMTIASR